MVDMAEGRGAVGLQAVQVRMVRPAALRASRIEVGGACTLDAEGVMNRKRVKAEYGRGKRAGRAWAESGRSIAAVEAVVSYLDADEEPKDELLAAMLREVYADGPDDEFEAMRQMAQNSAYVVGWYDGVSELYREQMTGGATKTKD